MNRRLLSVIITLAAVFVILLAIAAIVEATISKDYQLGSTFALRFVVVAIGLIIAFAIYWASRDNKMWEVGTRQVVYMAIGAALYAIFSFLFNGTVFVVPSVSQVALRPAIAIPMFFGYTFGPVVGFFTGAIGNMFGDALTGFGLSPQWSLGNGLIGLISGLVFLFKDKKKSVDTVLIISGVLAAIAVILFVTNRGTQNMMYYAAQEPVSVLAGISVVVGFVLVLIVRFAFVKNVDLGAAVIWAMLGNFIGLGFAAISDIWINGYSPVVAVVGEFLPAAGPNLVFAAILVPILVVAYAAVQQQSGR